MAERIPAGAFDTVAKLLRTNVKRPDGKDATAFDDDARSKAALRTVVNEHDGRIAAAEARLEALPFPFGAG